MKPVRIEEDAERELAGSVDFYERRRDGLGLEFGEAVQKEVRLIQAHPERYPLQKDGTRRLVMERFPFTIRFMEMPEEIWIVAFAHTSQDPDYWKPRLSSDE